MNFKGKQRCFCLPFQWGSTLVGKNLLLKEQVLPLKRRSDYGRDPSFREATWKSQFFLENVEIHESESTLQFDH